MKAPKRYQLQIPEKAIETQILNFLKLNQVFCWKNQSIGVYDTGRKQFRKSNNPNHIKGTSDVLGILADGRFLAIEVKSKKGRLTEEQKEFINRINERGGLAFVARSVEDVEIEFANERVQLKVLTNLSKSY